MGNWKNRGKRGMASVGIMTTLLGVPMDPVGSSKPLTQHRNWSKHHTVDRRGRDLSSEFEKSTRVRGKQRSGSSRKY